MGWLGEALKELAEQWEVVKSAWVFFVLFAIGSVWLSIRICGAFYRERIATISANLGFEKSQSNGYKAEIAGLKERIKQLESNRGEAAEPSLDLSPVMFGNSQIKSLFEKIASGENVRVEFNPTDSREWKSKVWKLPEDKFALYAAIRKLMEEGLARTEVDKDGKMILTGTKTSQALGGSYLRWLAHHHNSNSPDSQSLPDSKRDHKRQLP